MGLITGALQIGRSALLSYQSALQITGNNISNAGSPSYTRQSAVLSPVVGSVLPEGFVPGGGVALSALRRNVDESLENRIRIALGDQASAVRQQQTISRVETVLNELSDSDLSTLLQDFFNAFSNLQNQPHDLTSRNIVLTSAGSVLTEIQRQRAEMISIQNELNSDIAKSAERANELANDIAGLNVRIAELESTGQGSAGALRDQRDASLRELAELIRIEVREQPNGGINVYVGNEPLVQLGLSRGITTTLETAGGLPRAVVRFADNQGPIALRGGSIAGMVIARDSNSGGHLEALDSLAMALIQEVNKVHASGQGLEGYTSIVGFNTVEDPTAVLTSSQAGLPFSPVNGSFLLTIIDQDTGAEVTRTITVDLDGIGTDDSLQTIVDQINSKFGNLTAAVTPSNTFELNAEDGYEFYFSEDSSNVLAALGVNTFFVGSDAKDISINSDLISNPFLLAAAQQNTPGDGSNAAALAALGEDALPGLFGQSLNDFYQAIANNVAVKGAAALSSVNAADSVSLSLMAQRESISGVSLDEETLSLLKLERSFQGAARYAAAVDALIQEVLLLV